MAVGTHFYAQHVTKTTKIFLLADGKASWSLLPSLVSLLSGYTIPVSSRWQVRPEKTKKGALTLIMATTSVHLHKSVSTDETLKSDSSLTNPIGKNVRAWSM